MNDFKPSDSQSSPGGGIARGGLGLLAGVLICGAALAAQAAILRSVAGAAKKAS
jgi:hypothetical protein